MQCCPTLISEQEDYLFLTRSVKGKIRYYLLKIEKTLFGDYLLEKIYGNINYKRPTKVSKEYYRSLTEVEVVFNKIKKRKMNKGYQTSEYRKKYM